MNDTQTIKIFDVNNNLVEDFDDQVEKVLISVHGDKYYDVDEELAKRENLKAVNKEIEKLDKKMSEIEKE